MDGTYIGHYRMSVVVTVLTVLAMSGAAGFLHTLAVDADYDGWVASLANARNAFVSEVPRPVLLVVVGAFEIAMIVSAWLSVVAFVRKKVIFIINAQGIATCETLWEKQKFLAWDQIVASDSVRGRARDDWTFKGQGSDGQDVSLTLNMTWQKKSAAMAAVNAHRPGLAWKLV